MESPSGTRSFYQRNKGLVYVLVAQIFGVLMNVTTRLLEIEGNRGAGMHPFQVLHQEVWYSEDEIDTDGLPRFCLYAWP